MSFPVAHVVPLVTNGSGAATGYTGIARGPIRTVIYNKTDFANGVDFVVTTLDTGQTVWSQENVNASAVVCPRQATHSTAGVASLFASGGEPVEDYIMACGEKIKIVVAEGGATLTGEVIVIVG